MEYYIRENIFNKIMIFIRHFLYFLLKLDIHKKFEKFNFFNDNEKYISLLSYNVKNKYYRFNCYCYECPVNNDGLCRTKFFSLPFHNLHEFDNDNIIRNFCG